MTPLEYHCVFFLAYVATILWSLGEIGLGFLNYTIVKRSISLEAYQKFQEGLPIALKLFLKLEFSPHLKVKDSIIYLESARISSSYFIFAFRVSIIILGVLMFISGMSNEKAENIGLLWLIVSILTALYLRVWSLGKRLWMIEQSRQ
jgi:hypothetical protein